MDEMKFEDGKLVAWDVDTTGIPNGFGVVRGYSTVKLPVLGAFVIIEVSKPVSKVYPYKFLTIPEKWLKEA